MSREYSVCNFYKFFQLPNEVSVVQQKLEEIAETLSLKGLIIIASEGLNGTISGVDSSVASFKEFLCSYFERTDFVFKDGAAEELPFKRFNVKIRPEIVTTGKSDLLEVDSEINKLSPRQWHETLQKEEELVVLDVRNRYETELGMFNKATDPKTDNFKEFARFVEKAEIPKDKKILMYCTGGIRCEKAIIDMQLQGYRNVYQLDGGILNYLKEYPEGEFQGECFVFDHRVALDRDLQPTKKYTFCPHCGQPAAEKIACKRCGKDAQVCSSCLSKDGFLETCSKDCSYHYKVKSGRV
jgi:UPF0176 protein